MKFNPYPFHNIMRHFRSHLLVCFLLSGIALKAQIAPTTLHLRAFLFGGEARMLYLRDGEEIKSLRASPIQPSNAVQVQGRDVLQLFDQPGPNAEGVLPAPVATIQLPEGATHLLLLVLPGEEETKYGVMEDDLHQADARDWLFLNMTPSAIVFQIGEDTEPIIIQPRSRFAHRVPSEAGGNLPIRAAARHEGEVELFFSTYWPMRPDRRVLVLFAPDGDRIRVRRIMEPLMKKETP
jgi:hypothetical protein